MKEYNSTEKRQEEGLETKVEKTSFYDGKRIIFKRKRSKKGEIIIQHRALGLSRRNLLNWYHITTGVSHTQIF